MTKFKNWFEKKLIVGRIPDLDSYDKFIADNIDIIINVSDEHNHNMINAANVCGIRYFFFPMNEFSTNYDIGINSIYAALMVIYEAEFMNKKVYLHCHAGCNRSPTVQAAYYYMRTAKHLIEEKEFYPEIEKMFIDVEPIEVEYQEPKEIINNNRLLENIRQGYLPAQFKMEKFLHHCGAAFSEYFHNAVIPSLDSIKLKSKINRI